MCEIALDADLCIWLFLSIFLFTLCCKTCQKNDAAASLAQARVLVLKAVASIPLLGARSPPDPTWVSLSLLRPHRA